MLTCDNITYKDRFRGLGFSLVPGALLAVYGKDATGLILLMAGKLHPTQGSIIFEDSPIDRSRDYKQLSLYLPAQMHFRFWEKVESTVKRLARAGGGAAELAEAAMRYWGLVQHRDAKCSTLPLHLQKRVVLTQLLTHPRPVWLLDYPEQYLDAEGLTLLDTVIANRANQAGIVVLSTQRTGFMNHLPSITLDEWS